MPFDFGAAKVRKIFQKRLAANILGLVQQLTERLTQRSSTLEFTKTEAVLKV